MAEQTISNTPMERFGWKRDDGARSAMVETSPMGLAAGALPTTNGKTTESPALAVEVKDARLSYGRGAKVFHALKGANLRVPEGVIYGLLGPSGCGKTTLLTSVVGRRQLKQGEVHVFGKQPGTRECHAPGRWVGYMPQELALYPEFSIEETLSFFGRLHHLDRDIIKDRTAFLIKFLDLPVKSRLVGNLSGGQQRRVSFAAALIHRPPLLILDEPTVGVDPLLRKSMWNHLVRLTSMEGMTVIITTHYIEEARQANMVGLMRKGRLLAEASPDALIRMLGEPTLELCFLKLCLLDKDKEDSDAGSVDEVDVSGPSGDQPDTANPDKDSVYVISASSASSTVDLASADYISTSTFDLLSRNSIHDLQQKRKRLRREDSIIPDKVRNPSKTNPAADGSVKIWTLMWKNNIRLKRNPILLVYEFIIPSLLVVITCLCLGHLPYDLPFAVVNDEDPMFQSHVFLSHLRHSTIIQKNYTNISTAIESVKTLENYGALHIGKRFTTNLFRRISQALEAENDTIEGSKIKVYLDTTNQQIGLTMVAAILKSFQKFAVEMIDSYGLNTALANLPILFETPVYGSLKVSFTEFIAPGTILGISYFLAQALTSLVFVEERKGGFHDRAWVSGVTGGHVLAAHFIQHCFIVAIQVTGVLLVTFLVFNIPYLGPLWLVFAMTFLQALCGMAFGLVVSAISIDEKMAIMVTTGSFFSNMIISGIIWPLEAIPHVMRFVSYSLPQTLATEAMRAILSKGWDLRYTVVWSGFLVTIAWTIFFLVTAALLARIRS